MKRSVQVTGVGRAVGEPTRVRIMVTANAVRESMREAADAAASAASRVRKALAAAGIGDDAARTEALRFEPEWRQEGQPQRYAARQTIAAVAPDVAAVGALVTSLVEAGGDDVVIESVTFEVAEPAALAAAARDAAWADARAKAQQFAALAGASLGEVLTVSEAPGAGGVPLVRAEKLAMDGAAQPVVAGGVSMDATVAVTWALA